jgi:ketosteroid isomerase-like protein
MAGRTMLTLVIFAGLAAACGRPITRQPSEELAARGRTWQQAFDARDLETVVSLYTRDARFLPPNAEMAEGTEALRGALRGLIDSGASVSTETLEAETVGDLGFRTGTFELRTPDGTVVDRGKFLETWELEDGEWKIAHDMFNSSVAPPADTASVIFTHEVSDPEVWLTAWQGEASRHETFALHGATKVELYENPQLPTARALLVHVEDMDALRAFLDSPEGQEAAAEDAVRLETLRMYVRSE